MKNLQSKLDEITSESILADEWLNDNSNNEKVIEEERSMEQHFLQKNYQLEITKKMIESLRNTKQQKYLQLLRNLDEMSEKTNGLDQKIQEL